MNLLFLLLQSVVDEKGYPDTLSNIIKNVPNTILGMDVQKNPV